MDGLGGLCECCGSNFGHAWVPPRFALALFASNSSLWRIATPANRLTTARLFSIISLLSTLLLFAIPAPSQQEIKDIPNDLGEASLEELGHIQVYSASKHMQNASDAPSSVTVITADEIQKYGYRTLADILESVRGFYITYDRDYSFVGVRGFGRLGDSNNRILVLIDGHRINDNVFGEPYLGTEFLVDVDLIERVEIIRGPSSSLYGAEAFFAVINVVTRKPLQLKGGEVSFAPASFRTTRARQLWRPVPGIGMLLSGTFYNSQGQISVFPAVRQPGHQQWDYAEYGLRKLSTHCGYD